MLKIGLICSTNAAFPLLHWCHSQNMLAGVAVVKQPSEFYDDISVVAGRLNTPLFRLERENITAGLMAWQTTIAADIILVLSFSFKIHPTFLESIPQGCFNIHFGKLPDYAGPSPVFWQLVQREKQAVLTIHQMDESLDTGPIAVEIPFEIPQRQTFGLLDANYGLLAVYAAAQLLTGILDKTLILTPQSHDKGNPATRPALKDLILKWDQMNAEEISALVLATNPWNRGAIAIINGLDVKILDTEPGPDTDLSPGTIFRTGTGDLAVACKDRTSVIVLILFCLYGYFERSRIWSLGLVEGNCFERITL